MHLADSLVNTEDLNKYLAILSHLICFMKMYIILLRAVFFNLFAAAQPSANVWVAHGTLCNDPSVCIATIAQNYGCEFHPRQFWSVLAEPLAAIHGTLVEKHCLRVFCYCSFLGPACFKHLQSAPQQKDRQWENICWFQYLLGYYHTCKNEASLA